MAVVKNLMVRAGADFSAITKQADKAKTSMSGMQTVVTKSCSRMSSAMSGTKPAVSGMQTSVTKSCSRMSSAMSGTKTAMNRMQTVVTRSCSRMTSAVSGMKKVFGALGTALSVAAVVSFSKSAKKAYDTQTEAEAKLAQVMRNTIGASNEEIKAIKDLTAAQQALGVIGDEVQLAGAQELATYVTMTSTLEALIPVMNDMVAQQYGLAASGENAANIATMLGKVLSGQTSALSRYGYTFTKAQEEILKYGTEAQRAATLAEVVEQSVGGMNAALAATPSGRLKQVSNTLGDIKENAGQAVSTVMTVFLPALDLVCGVLADVATLSNKAAQSIANVFGGGKSSAAATVTYTGAAASGLEDVADEAEAAGKAVKSLDTYSFDTIQKLPGTSSSGVSSGGTASGTGGVITESTAGAEEAQESVGWLEVALARLKGTVDSLSFNNLAVSCDRLKAAAEPLTQTLFAGLDWAYDNVFEPLAHWTVESAAPAFLDMLSQSAAACNPALERLGNAVAPLASTAFEGLKWAYDNVFIPLGTWAGSELLPAFLDGLSGAAELLSFTLDALQPVGEWLWNEFLLPMASWTGDTIIAGMTAVSDILSGVSTWLQEHPAAVSTVVNAVLGYLGAMKNSIVGIVELIKNTFSLAFGVIEGVMTGSWDNARAAWGNCVSWFSTYVITPLQTLFSGLRSLVYSAFSIAWTSVKGVWSSAKSWFPSNVTTPISNAFTGFANGIIGSFEGIANGGISGINSIIGALNKLSFDIPDWVPLIGGGKFGFDLPTVSTVSLPRLAEGAVLPGNDPYLAIVNEQHHGVNVETPLTTMIEAFLTALNMAGLTGGGDIQVNVKAVFEGQLAALARLLRPYFEADAKRVGNKASTSKVVV